MICRRCNIEIPNEAKICGYCGARIVPEGVIYNGLGEDVYMPPTQEELNEIRRQNSPVTPPPVNSQQMPQMLPPPVNCQQTPQMAPPPVNCQQTPQMVPPPVNCQQTPQMAPPPVNYQQTPQMAPPPVNCQQMPQMVPPPVNNQQAAQTALPPVNFQQAQQVDFQQDFQKIQYPEPPNPLLSPEYHPQGGASPQFSNGFGYTQMPYNDAAVHGDGGAAGMAIASLVLGILGLLIGCCLPWITMIMSVIGLILSIVAIVKLEDGKGTAVGGLVCSIVAIIYAAFMLLVNYI